MLTLDKPLQELVAEHVASEGLQLPMFNPVALKMQKALSDEDVSITLIEDLLMEDPALASAVLRTANTAFYKGLEQITTIRRAVVRLGVQQVVSIAMAVSQRNAYACKSELLQQYMQKLWHHAFASAVGCRWIVKQSGAVSEAETAFLAGLLHDVGKLIILNVIEELNSADGNMALSPPTILELLDSSMHTEYGCLLMESWNLPEVYCTIARDHHVEEYSSSNNLLATVRLIDMACEKTGIAMQHDPDLALTASPEAAMLGLTELDLAQLEIELEDCLHAAGHASV